MHRILLVLLFLFATNLFGSPAPLPSPPPVSAKSYILLDFHSGKILAELDADQKMEPASITKIMTTYIVFHELKEGRLKNDDLVLISKKAWRMPGSRSFVEVGSKVSVDTLLKGVIIQSGNDATVALAEHIAGSEETFAALMNQHAGLLNMNSSHFINSTGLPHEEHFSTARDIATLTHALIKEFPDYYSTYSEKKYTYNNITQYNRNRLLWRDASVDGVKTGHTESAGFCLVTSAMRENMRLVSVVLADKSEEARATSSQALLNYGFRFFETQKLYGAGDSIKQVKVWKGEQELLDLGLLNDLYVTFPRGHYKELDASVELIPEIIAPAQKGQQFGSLNVKLDGQTLENRPLIALQSIETGSWWSQIIDSVKLLFE